MNRITAILAVACLAFARAPRAHAVPERYDLLISSGLLRLDDGDLPSALERFDAALARRPGEIEARYCRALCLNRMQRYAEAAAILERILAESPSYRSARRELGIARFGAGDTEGAVEELAAAAKERPDDAAAAYYLGRALLSSGRYDEAVTCFTTARALDPLYGDVCHYYAGVALVGKGEARRAVGRFKDAASYAGASPGVVAAARERLRDLEGRKAERYVRGYVGTRYEYDSNVVLAPDNASLVEVTGKDDFRFTVEPTVELIPPLGDRWETRHLLSFVQSVHHQLGDYNLQGYYLGNSAAFKGDLLQPFVGYNYEYNFLDDCKQSFLRSHTVFAGFSLPEGRWGLSEVRYAYRIDDYLLPFTDPEDDRDDHDNSIGLTQYLFAPRLGDRFATVGFFYDRSDAVGDNWTYDGFRFQWGVFTPLACEVNLDLQVELYLRDYLKSATGRDDTRQSYLVTFSRSLNDYTDVGLQYTYVHNASTDALFKYQRHIFSLIGGLKF